MLGFFHENYLLQPNLHFEQIISFNCKIDLELLGEVTSEGIS